MRRSLEKVTVKGGTEQGEPKKTKKEQSERWKVIRLVHCQGSRKRRKVIHSAQCYQEIRVGSERKSLKLAI